MIALNQITLDELAKLLGEKYRYWGYSTTGVDAGHKLKTLAEKEIQKLAQREGGMLFLKRHQDNTLTSAVFVHSGSLLPVQNQSPYWNIHAYTCPGEISSFKWTLELLKSLQPILKNRCEIRLDVWQIPMLSGLRKLGIYPSALMLEGNTQESFALLQQKYGEAELRDGLNRSGISIERLQSESDVDAYLKIIRQEFTRNPKFGAFMGTPAFQSLAKKVLLKNLSEEHPKAWVLRQKRKVIGGFDYIAGAEPFSGRKIASLSLALSQAQQGLGLSKYLYAFVLKELLSRGYDTYKGSTSQIGVMELGARMKRRLTGVFLESKKIDPFPRNYFTPWIKRLR